MTHERHLYDHSGVIRDTLKPIHLLSVLIIVAAAAIAQWLVFGKPESTSLERVRAGERLLAGYALEAPFVLMGPDGQISGEAPEVFRRVLAELGPGRIEWLHADFASLRHELEAGRIDVIVSGMFITPERQRHMLFSRPTAHVCPAFAVARGNPYGVKGYAEVVANPAVRIGAISGAVEHDEARRAGVPGDRLVAFPDALSAIAALKAGRIAVLALSGVSLRHALTHTEGLEMVSPLQTAAGSPPGRPAFAFRQADRDLRDAVDRVLAGWLGTPEHIALVEPFGFTLAEMPVHDAGKGCIR